MSHSENGKTISFHGKFHFKELEILKLIQTTLGCGTLRSRPDGIWYYEVNDLKEIISKIIPFFPNEHLSIMMEERENLRRR